MITKERYWKIIELFYNHKFSQIHLREIARQTKLHEPSVSRFLDFLEKDKILLTAKEGNLKKYGLRKNKKVYALFTLFDIEKLEKLPLNRKAAITSYLQTLTPPVFAILFGSTAKENYQEESDLDICKTFWKSPYAKLKYLNSIPKTVMAIYDSKEVFIFIEPEADLTESPALWSNNSSVVSMAKDCFEILWITALENPDYNINGEHLSNL